MEYHKFFLNSSAKCKQRIDNETRSCVNSDCPTGSRFDVTSVDSADVTYAFDCRMAFADHSGVLRGCVATGEVVESLLQCSVGALL